MSETQWGLLIQGVLALFTAYLGYKLRLVELSSKETKEAVRETKTAVEEVVLHTNSMKDALVKVTGEAEFAKGKLVGEGKDTKNAKD